MKQNNTNQNIPMHFLCAVIIGLLLSISCNASRNEFSENFIKELSVNKEIAISEIIILRVNDIKKNTLSGICYEQIKPDNVKLGVKAPRGEYDIISDVIAFHLYDGMLEQYNDKGEGYTTNFNDYKFKVSKTR